MKRYSIILAVLLCSTKYSSAQLKAEFAQFLRTHDSIMHIAYYDNNLSLYKRNFDVVLAGYNKLNAHDKEKFKPDIEDEYYNLARSYGHMGDKENALLNLERSNFDDYAELQQEPKLNVLRNDIRFKKLLIRAKSKKSRYGTTLEQSAAYNTHEVNSIPGFTYQSAEETNLVALKNEFNLDSIAGQGNDITRIINLMEWVHYLIPHDGSKGNPQMKNAMSMIKECRRDRKTLNCRGLAILLNEVYLAEGFKSRYVTCLPKDTTDNDCHVITMVWAESLKKWLWMDPTFMAYVMNEEGNLLSIEEVRGRLINNKPLLLNPDANRNHTTTQTKNDYLGYYMSKNLYKLECSLSSEYNYETQQEGKSRKIVQLIPGKSHPEPKSIKNEHGIDAYTRYYTNNPSFFWSPPPTDSANSKTRKRHATSEYEAIMNTFKDLYNQKNFAGLNELSTPEIPSMWDKNSVEENLRKFGMIKSVEFMGMEKDNKYEDVALFKVSCENSVHCMGIGLEDNGKLGTCRFRTYSNYIDWLLAKSIDKCNMTGDKTQTMK